MNIFGSPSSATKYEAVAGDIIQDAVRKEGHMSRVPRSAQELFPTHPYHIKILEYFWNEQKAGDYKAMGISKQDFQTHGDGLQRAGHLIQTKREGRWVFYRSTKAGKDYLKRMKNPDYARKWW